MTKPTATHDAVQIKPLRVVLVSRIAYAIAIAAVSLAVAFTVLALRSDRDGWKRVATEATTENQLLKSALFCRSDAAQMESAALGEVVINIGVTAEAALRGAIEPLTRERIIEIATALQDTSADLRRATDTRARVNLACAAIIQPTVEDTIP